MVGALLMRGMLVGVVAGLLAFGFAKLTGEPQVDKAIAFESAQDAAKDATGKASTADEGSVHHDMPDTDMAKAGQSGDQLVSRDTQSGLGLFVAVLAYGVAFGGLFGLVFAFANGRTGQLGARPLAALIAVAAFVTVVLVPALKYPASPPSVGTADTIGFRTGMFFLMIAFAIASLVAALALGRHLVSRHGSWNAAIAGGALFVLLVLVVQLALPDINEVPDAFPAVVLWRFRIAAIGLQLVMWTVIGLGFGWLAERDRR